MHPYRVDGPIDVYGLKNIHEVLVANGNPDRKVWITEYGWSNQYRHDNKAKWLKQSLDLLTSPELDFVFQASVHTLTDFDDAEYGLCDSKLNCRPAYHAFKNYPKDWCEIEKLHNRPEPPNRAKVQLDDFEGDLMLWACYGDGLVLRQAKHAGITPETGKRLIAAVTSDKPLAGGAYRLIETAPNVPVYVDARAFTDQRGDSARNSRARVGIDPTGAMDPKAQTVVWGRWIDTSGEWDSAGVGRGESIVPKEGKITVFLDYVHSGGTVGQISAFDNIRIVARVQ